MPEDYYASRAISTGSSFKGFLLAGLLSFAGGAALVGYLVWNGQIDIGRDAAAPLAAPLPSPNASPLAPAALDQQIAAMEQRLARLGLQAAAFDGTSVRAEGLLVAFATRRAIDHGQPLGYLESQLQTRFGSARPDAVKAVTAAARTPLTLDMLAAQLDDLGPALLGTPRDESAWQGFTRTMSSLFVIKRDDGSARPAERRLETARLMLRSGRVNEAIAEIAQMPGNAAAAGWIAAARRYADTQAALDQIEQAALTEPQLLKSGEGETVNQPGLGAPVVPTGTPAPRP